MLRHQTQIMLRFFVVDGNQLTRTSNIQISNWGNISFWSNGEIHSARTIQCWNFPDGKLGVFWGRIAYWRYASHDFSLTAMIFVSKLAQSLWKRCIIYVKSNSEAIYKKIYGFSSKIRKDRGLQSWLLEKKLLKSSIIIRMHQIYYWISKYI